MWVFTRDGFYSAVHDGYCGKNEIAVRARSRRDLERLIANVNRGAKAGRKRARIEIIETPQADYRFRIIIPARLWVQFVTDSAAGIDYPNFKNAAAFGPLYESKWGMDIARGQWLHEVWGAGLRYQNHANRPLDEDEDEGDGLPFLEDWKMPE